MVMRGGNCGAESASTTNGLGASSHQTLSGWPTVSTYPYSFGAAFCSTTNALASPKAIAVPAVSTKTTM